MIQRTPRENALPYIKLLNEPYKVASMLSTGVHTRLQVELKTVEYI